MQNPFAVAVQWPNEPRRYVVHLQRPYFTAAMVETASALWLLVSWSPGSTCTPDERATIFRAAAQFCQERLDQVRVAIEFVERKHGYPLPRFLMAQATDMELFIVEPEHPAPLVEVRERHAGLRKTSRSKLSQRLDVVTQWRLEQMRNYYRQYLERQPKTLSVAKYSSIV